MNHEPGLDGLRGVAVAGVVLFHAGFSWAVGGFLGVSTFFTLSGFLITSLLLREQAVTGRVALGAFWARRARRLLPAALATLLAVSALAPWLATPGQLDGLRGDVLAALGYVANWRFMLSGQSYGDLFSLPSPVLHFWSLAIEEQLYILFPLLVAGTGRRRWFGWLLAGSVVGSVALGWVLYTPGESTSAAYYGTFVRAGELLVGALLAVLLHGAARRRVVSATVAVRVAGVVALAAVLWSWTAVRQDDTVLYRGGFVVHAVLSAVVILAAMAGGGPVRALLSAAPLQALGRISYGVYLVHWPVLVWWDAPLAAQLGLTLVLAVASYVVLEQPIRRQRLRVPVLAVPAIVLAVAGVAVASTLDPPPPARFDLATGAAPPLPADPVAPVAGAPVVGVFGDSTALRTAFALKGWGWTTGRIDMRDGGADVGCPLARGGVVDFVSVRQRPHDGCDEWPERWESLARGLDVALVQIGPWDVTDREVDGDWTHIGEAGYDALLEREMHLAVDVLSADGALVVWLTSPAIDFAGHHDHPINEPSRMARLNELIRSVDAAREEMVVLDLVAWLRAQPGGERSEDLRPDGVHFSEEASEQVAEWLAPAIIDLVDATLTGSRSTQARGASLCAPRTCGEAGAGVRAFDATAS